jgi:hypothetical protein
MSGIREKVRDRSAPSARAAEEGKAANYRDLDTNLHTPTPRPSSGLAPYVRVSADGTDPRSTPLQGGVAEELWGA